MTDAIETRLVTDTCGDPSEGTALSPQRSLQPDLTNTGLPGLAREIEAFIAAGKEAQSEAKEAKTRAKGAKAEATRRFIEAGKLLIEAKDRVEVFETFLKEYFNGLSPSWAYRLIRMAGRAFDNGNAGAASEAACAREAPASPADADASASQPRQGGTATPTHIARSASATAQKPTYQHGSPERAKRELKWAIDHYWPLLDHAGKEEMTTYFHQKAGVQVS